MMIKTEKEQKKDMGKRTLSLPSELNQQFRSIRDMGNFEKFSMHDAYHYFYSISVGFSADIIYNSENLEDSLENLSEIQNREVKSIDSPQLEKHDDFFKTIAYWYLLKKNKEDCYKILVQTNEARKICEMFFKENWSKFKEKISNFNSDYPDIQMITLIEEKLKRNTTEN